MSRSIPKPRTPSDPKKPDSDTASYKQRMGGDDPPAPRGGANPRLPHERDESARATGDRLDESPTPSDRQISQAGEDVERGLVDTDRRGVPDDLPKRKTT
jgi:hypothetical protein